MTIGCDFLYEIGLASIASVLSEAIDNVSNETTTDDSAFVYVDGEEGDYGVVKHFLEGVHVWDHVIEGGDVDHHVFSEKGREVLSQVVQKTLEAALQKVSVIPVNNMPPQV
ncbi:hypothetical protein ACI2KR_27320 [Pseudomonas luteola]